MSRVTLVAQEQETVAGPAELLADSRLNIYKQVTKKNYFQARITTDGLTIQAGSHIGHIPLNDEVTLQVTPRVPLANLARLLTTINHTGTALQGLLRNYDVEPGMYPSLVALYAASMRSLLETLSHDGLLRRYFQREAEYSAPRGRVNVSRTLQTEIPRGSPFVATSYFERSVDTAENRTLLSAVVWLHKYALRNQDALSGGERRQVFRDLNQCNFFLRGVEYDPDRKFLRDPVVSGRQALPALRRNYRPVLDLALIVLNQQAVIIERAGQRVEMETLLINMEDVFEAYVREVLDRKARHDAWPELIRDGNLAHPAGAASKLFSDPEHDNVGTTPDIACERPSAQCRYPVILDAKYRPLGKRIERKDLEQVLLYALAYQAPHVVVIQPCAERGGGGLRLSGVVAGVSVYVYGFDLGADLDVEEQAFTDSVRGLCLAVS